MKWLTSLLGAFFAGLAMNAQSLTLEFGNAEGHLRFDGNGDRFQFIDNGPSPGFGLRIVNSDHQPGDAIGKMGSIRGVFQIGDISQGPLLQSAPVSGTGSFELDDGSGFVLTANLTWESIRTSSSIGTINFDSAVNVTGIRYEGQLPDFVDLANAQAARMVLTFQFLPERSLTDLTADGAIHITAFAGQVTAVPEPSLFPLIALVFAAVSWVRLKRRYATTLKESLSA